MSVPRSWRTVNVMVALSGTPTGAGDALTTRKRVWLPSKDWMDEASTSSP